MGDGVARRRNRRWTCTEVIFPCVLRWSALFSLACCVLRVRCVCLSAVPCRADEGNEGRKDTFLVN